jgi:hypothetical protein
MNQPVDLLLNAYCRLFAQQGGKMEWHFSGEDLKAESLAWKLFSEG